MNLSEKKRITEDLHERFSKAQVVIIADYKGLDVTSVTKLRSELRNENVEFQVAKNSLIIRAAQDTDTALLTDYCKGPNAVALSYDDPVAPAKVLSKFAKENDKLEIKVGVMNGKVLMTDDINALADLPSRDVLLGQILSAMNGVPTSFVRVLNEVPRQMLNVLQAIKDQKEAA